jgi:hypothetical protein
MRTERSDRGPLVLRWVDPYRPGQDAGFLFRGQIVLHGPRYALRFVQRRALLGRRVWSAAQRRLAGAALNVEWWSGHFRVPPVAEPELDRFSDKPGGDNCGTIRGVGKQRHTRVVNLDTGDRQPRILPTEKDDFQPLTAVLAAGNDQSAIGRRRP